MDTHVLRQLGEMLVGRDSTALMELVKNSYDADAAEVIIYGEGLDNPERGLIRIVDNGTGMTRQQFVQGFLTIASRIKEMSDRYSAVHHRRYTGAKGLGRLAAHKLARSMQVVSVAKSASGGWTRIEAEIDWDELEKHRSLDATGNAIRVKVANYRKRIGTGTAITLRRLRTRWTPRRREQFVVEARSFEPPVILARKIEKQFLPSRMLVPVPGFRDDRGEGFRVSLEGEFEGVEARYDVLLAEAAWVLEIDGSNSKRIKVRVSPTARTLQAVSGLEPREFILDGTADGRTPPEFQSRILIRFGQSTIRDRLPYGIRVFMEGFRVLPYGEPGDDWLRLDYDAVRRLRSSPDQILPIQAISGLARDGEDSDAWLSANSQRQYFGAVFLTESTSRGLRMLINREGFIPDAPFLDLVEVLRTAVYLSVRVRAGVIEARKELRNPRRDAYGILKKSTDDLKSVIEKLPKRPEDLEAINAAINSILSSVAEVARAADQINVLASIGTLTAAFVHEMSTVVGMARSIESELSALAPRLPRSSRLRPRLASIQENLIGLRRQFEQQSTYLTDVISAESRNRRSPQPISQRFDSAQSLLAAAVSKAHVEIVNELPTELRSSNMYPAELVSVMMNLLSNAIKAAGRKGKVKVSGSVGDDDHVRFRLENTGARVEPGPKSERWFQAFESTTTRVDPELGQGMGLGLYITRFLLERRNARIAFAEPSVGFSTSVEIDFGVVGGIKTGRSK